MPRPDRSTFRRALLLGGALVLATLSCGREVTGPSGTQLMRGFTFDARFDTPGLANGVAGTIVSFTKVRVVLVNSRGDTVVNRLVDFPSTSDEVSLSFDVPVVGATSASGESMSLALAYINAQNDTVFRGGPLPVQVVPSLPGSEPPVPPVVPVTYVGVGANAASVVISPPTLSVLSGDPFAFTAVAFDGQGAPIANTPVAWRSESPTRATVTAPGAGSGLTLPSRGSAMIIAQLLGATGAADTVMMNVLPRAQSLVVVSGNNQTATLNTALAQPLVVRVNATDGVGMQGVTVNFAVTSGGGGVSAPSVVTDVNGLAQVTWTAGNALGAQTVSATATGLTGSPATFTASGPLTLLLHHYPMTTDLTDAVGSANGTLFGGASIVDGTLSLDGSGFAQFASNLIPTSGSFSVSLFVRDRGPLALVEYISQGASNAPGFYLGHLATGVMRAGDGWPNTDVTAPAIDGLFHHVVFVSDSTANTSQLYVDGTLRATLPSRTEFSATGDFTRLGRQFGIFNEFLTGDLDELKIARGALSAAQITALHLAGATTSGRIVFSTQPTNVVANAVIAPAVVVRVEDALGRLNTTFNGPVTVALSTNPGGATLGGTLTVNAVAGVATFSTLTVNTVASGYQLSASASGIVSGPSATFNVMAGAATQLAFVQQPTNTAPNTAFAPPLTVVARDAQGNMATGFTGAVTIAIGTNPSGAVLGGTVSVNAIAGVATFNDVRVSLAGVGYTLTAAATGLTGTTSTAVTISSGAATRLDVTQQPTTAVAGITLTPSLVVTARDAGGSIATGFTGAVTVGVWTGVGSVNGTLTVNAVAGIATFADLSLTATNVALTLRFNATGLAADTTDNISVGPGAPTELRFGSQPTDELSGQVITPPVTVYAVDALGNSVPGFAGTVTMAFGNNAGGGLLGGTLAANPAAGIATFSNLTVAVPASGYTLSASSSGMTSATSTVFNIGAGALVNVWTNAAGGNWSVPSNWSLGRAPIVSDTVMLLTSGTYTVTMDVNDTVGVMIVGGGVGVQTLAIGARALRVETAFGVQPTGVVTILTSGAINGPGTVVNNGTIDMSGGQIATPIANASLFAVHASVTLPAPFTTTPTSILRLSATGTVNFTITNGLVNNGTLELTSQNAGFNVLFTTPTLVNSSTGVINVLAGTGGNRTLAAQLDNQGTINLPYALNLAVASAAHVNSGTISMTAGDLTITQTGTAPSFTNTGTIAVNGRTVNVNGGALELSGGFMTGTGGLLVTVGAPTVRFTTASVQPRVSFSATTILPDPFVIPAGDSLRVRGGTFAPPSLTNNGTLILESTAIVTSNVTTGTGSTIRLRASSAGGGTANVSFTNPLANSATLDMITQDAAYTMSLTTPRLLNTSSGVINTLPGTGGSRTIIAQLDNQGTINVSAAASINGAGADHVNSGTITLGASLQIAQTGTTPSFTNTGTIATNGRTVQVDGGTLDLSSGLVSGTNGFLQTTGVTTVRFLAPTVQPRVTLSATTVLPDPFVVPSGDSLRVFGGTFAPPSLTNNGTLILEGATTVSTAVTTGTGSVIRIRGTGVTGAPTITFTNPLTNSATIDLTNENAGYTLTLIAPSLLNTSSGVINSLNGAGGSRTLATQLTNQGTINVPFDLSLNAASAAHVNSGTIALTTGDLGITQTGTTPSFTNTGTIATNGRAVTVSGGTLDLSAGLISGFNGFLVTTGAPTVRFVTSTVQPRVTLSATTVLPDPFIIPAGDSLRVRGTFAPPSLTNNGTLLLEGTTTVTTAVTTNPGSTIRLRGTGVTGAPTITFTNPLTNSATLDLTNENAGYTIFLIAPSLLNTSSGVINVLNGAGGSRTIAAQLDNQGIVNVPFSLTLNQASAAHVNAGSINLTTGDLGITQTGTTPSFTNTGTIATNGRTVTVSNGLLDLTAGLVSGYNGFLVTSGAPTVRFLTSTVQPRVSFSTTTVLPDPFTVPASDSLRITTGTFAPPSLTNNGTLLLEGTTTISTALTTGTGSLIRVRGTGTTGAPTITFTNPVVNSATLDLTNENAGYSLNLVAPSLLNTSSGVINSLAGAGGSRTLQTELNNQGTINVPFDLSLNRASAAHVNSGSILLTTGDLGVTQTGTTPSFTNTGTIATNGRSVTVAGGLLDLQAGVITGYTGFLSTTGAPTVRFLTSTVQPRVTFSATTVLPDPFTIPAGDSLRVRGTFAPPSLTNNGVFIVEGTTTVSTAITTGTGSTIRIRGTGTTGAPTVTFTNPLTNSATLDLVTENAGYVVNFIAPSVTNTATGVINSLNGAGGTRNFGAQLTNAGTVNVPFDLNLTPASAAHTNSGLISMTTGDFNVTQTGTAPSFTNTGTVATNGRIMTVAGGTLDLSAGLVSGYTGFLVTTGAPSVRFLTTTVQPRVTLSATTVLPDPFTIPAGDSLRVRGTFAPPSVTNNGLLVLEGTTTVNTAVTTGTGSVVRVRGTGTTGAPTITFTNALTNSATLDLTTENAGYTVVMNAPSLTNTGSGVINSLSGAGGTRTLVAELNNQGTINVPFDLALNRASAAHLNSGSILLTTGDLIVTQTGTTPSFTNTGTIATNGRSVSVAGGMLDLTAGLISGYTGFLGTTGAATVRFLTTTVQPRVTFSATTVLPDPFTIPAGDSLRVTGGTFAPLSLTNNGTLYLEGAATINTAVTTGAGSRIRVRGTGTTGAPSVTFTNALTNSATLDFVTENAGYAVLFTAPSVLNTSSGVIDVLNGAGGTRTFAAELNNQGTVNIPYDLILNRASAAHVNSGNMVLTTGDLTVTQTGTTPSFTNTGTIATNGRAMSVGGGSLDLTAGMVSGYTGFVTTTGAPTVRFNTAAVQSRVTFSATTVLPDPIVIPVGDSLRVRGGTLAPPSLTVNGTLVLEGSVTVAPAIVANAGALTLVRGSTAGGGSVTATLQNSMTNAGTLRMTVQDAGYGATLNLGANTLTNAAGGTFDLALGSNGSRTVTAGMIENLGTLSSNYTTAMNSPVNQRGVMTIATGTSLTIQGLLQLFTGSTTTVNGTLVKTGTCANLGGTIGGPGVGATCP